MNNQQNTTAEAEAQQAAFLQQQKIAYQQQQQMFMYQQRMMACQQIQGAVGQLDPTQVIKTFNNYGISLPLDPYEKQAILQQLSAVLGRGKMAVENWEYLSQALVDALGLTQRNMLQNSQMAMGMGGMGMMQQPMMGGMGMMGMQQPMMGMGGMGMMSQPMMGGMSGMGMMGMQQPMMMNGMGMGGMGMMQQPMMGGMSGMGMGVPQAAAADGKDPAVTTENRIATLRAFINQNIVNVDPIIFIQCIFGRGISFDSVPELDQVLRVAISNASMRVSDAVLQVIISVVSALFNQRAPTGNANGQQNAQQPMMGGMPGMGMGMMGMQQPMMMNGMGMGGMGMMPPNNGMGMGMGMGMMGMQQPMMMNGMGMGGMGMMQQPMMMNGMQQGNAAGTSLY